MKYKALNGWTKAKMIKHIKRNFKGKSMDHTDKNCLYRAEDGRKCAVGMFIPDELYTVEMEGLSSSAVLREHPELVKFLPLQQNALDALQSVHDESYLDETLKLMMDWIKENVK